MTLFERIKFLANKQGKSINDVERDLKYSTNTLYRLKNNKPGSEKLEELADYFNVSTDYLLGRETNNKNSSSDDIFEEQARIMFRKETDGMNENQKKAFNQALEGMMKTAKSLTENEDLWK